MRDWSGESKRRRAVEELVLATIAAHAESLLRTARRHSICADDAQDAYQRAIELFMGHAGRLDAARAPSWLHVVVKREAQAIAQARRKLLGSGEVDLDGRVAPGLPTPEEQLLSVDMVSRSAEALKRLKPHELRALWLRAQGHSYSEIGAITGWSYTKVNRCLSEGRRSFLEQYACIESGAECDRWLPVLSAMVDGEATSEQVLALRPHLRNCPGCRATLRMLQDSSRPLAALLPVGLVAGPAGVGEQVSDMALRLFEGLAGGLHERAANSMIKLHAVLEASAAGKVTAVAASAAAIAGTGLASIDQMTQRPPVQMPVARAGPATDSSHGREPPPPPPVSTKSPNGAAAAALHASAARSAEARSVTRTQIEFAARPVLRRQSATSAWRSERRTAAAPPPVGASELSSDATVATSDEPRQGGGNTAGHRPEDEFVP
jgi:DNA-directed RNA polymerase specialized sigma24 family protein